MATLQSDCARKFGVTAQDTLDAAQNLYEKYKVLTYPRSNCKYLGDEHFNDRHSVLQGIASTAPKFARFVQGATATTPHACFNTKKVGAHHGIIPTATKANFDQFTDLEKCVYQLVARAYIAILYPNSEYSVSDVDLKIADLQFSVSSETNIKKGWESLYTKDQDNPDIEESSEFNSNLSDLKMGQNGTCIDSFSTSRAAPSPKYYVESTLLRDLTHIAKHIKNQDLKLVMDDFFKEKGIPAELGTEATRASVIEKVFESGLAIKVKEKGYKELAFKTSDIGKQFISFLPDGCKTVDVTAEWVRMGVEIKNGNMTVKQYVDSVYQFIESQVSHVKAHGVNIKVDLESCHLCFDGYLKPIKTDKGVFFGCTNHPTCTATFPEYKGKPYTQTHNCPKCQRPMVLRKSANEYFFGCTGYQDGCSHTMGCIGGKPAQKTFKKKPQKRVSKVTAKRVN